VLLILLGGLICLCIWALPAGRAGQGRSTQVQATHPTGSDALAQRFASRIDVGQPPDFSRIRDCADLLCPWMRVIPGGQFVMGDDVDAGEGDADEAPAHLVMIKRRFAVMETEVTVAQFRAFVADSGYQHGGGCVVWNGKAFVDEPQGSWRLPFVDMALDDSQPVVCVSWIDAQAFAHWMTEHTGQVYRLLTEAEWEYTARAGSRGRFSFGDTEADLCRHANVADAATRRLLPYIAGASCDDGYPFIAPVGSFLPNAWGLFDMMGNAWEWVQDCKSAYDTALRDGHAVDLHDCPYRQLRGGSWANRPAGARTANRDAGEPGHRDNSTGFRLARDLPTRSPAAAGSR
jgi:formylglycine-generating enzyme required for sulfatase activity